MKELVICVGIPASGKTSYSINWVSKDNENRFRVNSDDIRNMSYNAYSKRTQNKIDACEVNLVKSLLDVRNLSIIVDNMNIKTNQIDQWFDLVNKRRIQITYLIFNENYDDCVKRNSQRLNQIITNGDMEDFYNEYLKTVEYLQSKELKSFEHIVFVNE